MDLNSRREWLESAGVARQYVAPWLDIHGYSLPADKAADWARLLNTHIARCTAEAGSAFQPVATVPLSDGEAAARELEFAVNTLDIRGAMLPSDPVDIDVADPGFEPLWAAAEELAVPIFLHGASHSKWEQVGASSLGFSLGRTLDTSVLAAKLILGGLLDRHPKLKLVLCHGGGFLPYQVERLCEGYRRGSDKLVDLELGDPEAYLSRLYYDAVTLNARSLQLLIDLAGSEQIMLGSDFVWGPNGDMMGGLRQLGLSDKAHDDICRGTALNLFRGESLEQ